MKVNEVIISLEEFNILRDFYRGIDENKFVQVNNYYGIIYYKTEKQVLKNLKNTIKELRDELDMFKNPDKKTIKDVGKMNIIQFLKWKRNLK